MKEKHTTLKKVAKPNKLPAIILVIVAIFIAGFFITFNHFYKVTGAGPTLTTTPPTPLQKVGEENKK